MQSVDCMGTPADYIDLPGGPVQIVTRYSARAAEAKRNRGPPSLRGCPVPSNAGSPHYSPAGRLEGGTGELVPP